MAAAKGVLVVGELVDENVAGITGELLGVCRRLADALGGELSAVFLGSNIKETAKQAFVQGADNVYAADDPAIEDYQPELYVNIVERMCEDLDPSVLILGATPLGRDLAPRLSWRLKSGLASDCVELNIDPETNALIATRPVYGGKALAEVDCGAALPAMATVRPESQQALQPDPSRSGEVMMVAVDADSAAARTRVVDSVIIEVKGDTFGGCPYSGGWGKGSGQCRELDGPGGVGR